MKFEANTVVPVPSWTKPPAPVIWLAKAVVSDLLTPKVAPASMVTLPTIEPAVPPSPMIRLPRFTSVPPVKVLLPVSTVVPVPSWTTLPASGPSSEMSPAKT